MSKAYSNRALPAGTVLREWRLEEILGVGGFGIVYKGRGIYFDELVAIKEYFPSAISERAEDETVVPVDSNAEEVHALGLKKFVEEAKLLWNLSTPTRHPNIVSVRSLFEIHGTAYMVMDFEDGTPLSRLLKNGIRFNEASLKTMVIPICEGLERAHRVGVLHRDIKPPNIIVNDDGRSVLIDFGSARFESGEATSTTVTFHTPPYAAIEQYVRTYPQGPWTDIYALGVVLYECITGKKPAEVLERVHGDAGAPLAEGDWPGFSRGFLAAVDAAMALRPEDRPQSIGQWLTMLREGYVSEEVDDEEEDVTRIGGWEAESPSIIPVAPPKEGFSSGAGRIETGVPETPSRANFTSRAEPDPVVAPVDVPAAKQASKPAPAEPAAEAKAADAPTAAPKSPPALAPARPAKSRAPLYAGLGLAAVAIAGVAVFAGGGGEAPPKEIPSAPVALAASDGEAIDPASVLAALSEEAARAGIGSLRVKMLAMPENEATPDAGVADGNLRLVLFNFASAVAGDAQRRLRQLTSQATSGNTVAIAKLREQARGLREGANAISAATDDQVAIAASRDFIDKAKTFLTAANAIWIPGKPAEALAVQTAPAEAAASATPGSNAASTPGNAAAASSSEGVTSATRSEFRNTVRESRSLVDQVVRLGRRDRPGSNATDAEREAYRIRQNNANSAERYDDYLDTLESSMRGITTNIEATKVVTNAYQTRAYLRDMLAQSQNSLR